MSKTAKPAKKQPILKFSPEVTSLLENSNTHPAVLMLKLATDNLTRRYDAEALVLRGQREKLMEKVMALITEPEANPGLHALYKLGAEVTFKVDYSLPAQNTSFGSHLQLAEMFKSLDVYAPKSISGGFNRLMGLDIYTKGPALSLVASHLLQNTNNVRDSLKTMLEGTTLTTNRMRFGCCDNEIKVKFPEPELPEGKVKGGWMQIYLENLDLGLAQELEALGKKEVELLNRMLSDLRLLATKSTKARSLETVIRRIPDLLEHPDLKLLLGYNINPQEERIQMVASALTGAAFLNPAGAPKP